MGTRADFYLGRGKDATWLGSIAFDGYPEGIPAQILRARTATEFIEAVGALCDRDDWTGTRWGWPWPWEDSQTTDYAYAFDDGTVWACYFGNGWFDPGDEPDWDDEESLFPKQDFPDMSAVQNVTWGPRSGLIILGGPTL